MSDKEIGKVFEYNTKTDLKRTKDREKRAEDMTKKKSSGRKKSGD